MAKDKNPHLKDGDRQVFYTVEYMEHPEQFLSDRKKVKWLQEHFSSFGPGVKWHYRGPTDGVPNADFERAIRGSAAGYQAARVQELREDMARREGREIVAEAPASPARETQQGRDDVENIYEADVIDPSTGKVVDHISSKTPIHTEIQLDKNGKILSHKVVPGLGMTEEEFAALDKDEPTHTKTTQHHKANKAQPYTHVVTTTEISVEEEIDHEFERDTDFVEQAQAPQKQAAVQEKEAQQTEPEQKKEAPKLQKNTHLGAQHPINKNVPLNPKPASQQQEAQPRKEQHHHKEPQQKEQHQHKEPQHQKQQHAVSTKIPALVAAPAAEASVKHVMEYAHKPAGHHVQGQQHQKEPEHQKPHHAVSTKIPALVAAPTPAKYGAEYGQQTHGHSAHAPAHASARASSSNYSVIANNTSSVKAFSVGGDVVTDGVKHQVTPRQHTASHQVIANNSAPVTSLSVGGNLTVNSQKAPAKHGNAHDSAQSHVQVKNTDYYEKKNPPAKHVTVTNGDYVEGGTTTVKKGDYVEGGHGKSDKGTRTISIQNGNHIRGDKVTHEDFQPTPGNSYKAPNAGQGKAANHR